ncbi:helix-turn-helix domain-containing protein [Ralstonia pseudosolanacearum]|uniref:helix-turn-helix domain-containing protein n=1 Tax=Ralstonia pseudosolanacearum TaxID=1310165 RepID=UPI0008DA6C56|nr:helix-turn-helix transcriptional regulator [Ralstonia pseudosolanacearum]MCL1618373.1 helix-turn-helix domain-containing protein [Ralstonia pseudosolanacearum CaRs-Mep]
MTESANTFTAEVGERLRAYRTHLGWSQERFGMAIGGTKRGLQENESGRNSPQARILAELVRLGCNVNWLLTGDGPMLMKDLEAGAQGPASPLDEETLEYVIEALEQRIAAAGKKPAAKKKAEAIAALYDYVMDTGHKGDAKMERILRLVA